MRLAGLVLTFVMVLAFTAARAEVSRPQDRLALRQLQTLAVAPWEGSSSPVSLALDRVTSRLNWAADVARLLSERKPLGAFDPLTWSAVSPELCRVAGLDLRRCVSLPCLVPQLSPTNAIQCPRSLPPVAGSQPPPDDPARLGEWLDSLGKATSSPIKVQLLRRELPIDPDIVEAKGILHAIWPDLLEAAGRLAEIKAENVQPLLQEVLLLAGERSARAARLVAAGRAIRELSPSARAFIEPMATRLLDRAAKIEALYKEPVDATLLLASSVRGLEADLDAGDQTLSSLGTHLARSLVDQAFGAPSVRSGTCPATNADEVHELASTYVANRKFALALRGTSSTPGEREFVAVLGAREPAKVAMVTRGPDGKDVRSEIEASADCLQSIIPLGITIANIEEREGKLIFVGAENALIQREIPDRFRAGINELLAQIGENGLGLPATVIVSKPRLAFSSDLTSIALVSSVTIPVLNVTVPTRASLVDGGRLVLRPSAAGLLDLPSLVAQARANIIGRDIDIGPIKANITALDQARPELIQSGTWLEVAVKLKLANIDLGEATAQLVDRGGVPRFELITDLTTLIRRPLVALGARVGTLRRVSAEALPDTAPELLDELANALLIERARIADDGKSVVVKLGLDLASITGQAALPRVTAEGALRLDDRSDLGLRDIYKELLKNALGGIENLKALMLARLEEKLGRKVQDAAVGAIDDAIRALNTIGQQSLGIKLSFKRTGKPGEGTMTASWDGGSASLGIITVIPAPPRIDFSGGRIDDADGQRLGKKLEAIAVGWLKSLVGLEWKACGEPRVARSAGGIIIELSAEASIVGCVPLPAVVFDGTRLAFDGQRTIEAIRPILEEKVKLLVPSDLRKYVTIPRWDPRNTEQVRLDVKARAPGTAFDLKGTVLVNLKDLTVKVEANPEGVIFDEILKQFTGLTGSGFKVEPVQGRMALRASGSVDFGVVGLEIREMELTPDRVYLPEIGVKLPAAVIIGPFTVFPIELRSKLQKPTRVGIVGDASFANLSQIVRIRSRIGFDLPNPKISLDGTLTVVEVLDLFEMSGEVDLAKKLLRANARTTGVLAAIMPAEQLLTVDPGRAQLDTSIKLLFLAVKGRGEIRFAGEPGITLDGSADLGGLAGLKAGLDADLLLRRPTASVEGGIGLPPIGDIKFGAKASLQSVRLSASIIGIQASLILPSIADLNGGLIKKLFEALLKPSIDLKNLSLKNVSITLAPRIGGGDGTEGSPSRGNGGNGGNGGDGGGPQITPVVPGPNANWKPVVDRAGAVRTGTIPSAWQYGWLPSPDPGMLCEARWKGPQQIQWLSSMRSPESVVQMFKPPERPRIELGTVPSKVEFWSNCEQGSGSANSTKAIAFFDGTDVPKVWHQGTRVIENGVWIDAALKQLGGPGAAGVSRGSMPSNAAVGVLQTLHRSGLTGDVANSLRTVKLSNNQVFYRVAPASGQGTIHLIEAGSGIGQTRSFQADGPLGKLIMQVTAEPPTALAPLKDVLLPLLFAGREPRILSDVGGRLLLEVNPFGSKPSFVASFGTAPPLCGSQAELEREGTHAQENDLFDPIAVALLAENPACSRSARWTKLFTVADRGGQLQRVVGIRDNGAGDWVLEFVDAKGKCLRSMLSGPNLRKLIETWKRDGLPEADKLLISLGADNGLSIILSAIRSPEIAWRAAGFRLDPFLAAVCGGGQ